MITYKIYYLSRISNTNDVFVFRFDKQLNEKPGRLYILESDEPVNLIMELLTNKSIKLAILNLKHKAVVIQKICKDIIEQNQFEVITIGPYEQTNHSIPEQ